MASIVAKGTLVAALVVAALRVEWAEKMVKSMPAAAMMDLVHRLIVSLETPRCGGVVVMKSWRSSPLRGFVSWRYCCNVRTIHKFGSASNRLKESS